MCLSVRLWQSGIGRLSLKSHCLLPSCQLVYLSRLAHFSRLVYSTNILIIVELRRHYFTHRVIVSAWNSLPNSFKSRLDKFWSMHDFVYDYRASPLAARSVQCNSHIIAYLKCITGNVFIHHSFIQCESKNLPSGFLTFSPKRLGIFNPFLHTYYAFLSTLDDKFLFNYLQR